MIKTIISASALTIALGAGTAFAECEIGKTTAYGAEDDAVQSIQIRQDLRQIRNAAMMLKSYGKEDACQTLVSAIQEIRQERADKMQRTGDENVSASDHKSNLEKAQAEARPVNEMSDNLTVARMIDADLRGSTGEVVGEIRDIVLSKEGNPSHVVVEFGGFLGVGEDQAAVPFNHLRATSKVGEDDGMTFYIPMTLESLENAPRFQRGDRNWLAQSDWMSKNDEYFEENTIKN